MEGRIVALVLICTASNGCASICCLPHECACAIDSLPSCDSLGDGESSGSCACDQCRCAICQSGRLCPLARRQRELLIAVGPPAIRHQPEMPPEFLPVPPRPVFANVNMQAPRETRGAIDASFGPELTIQGRD